MQINCNQWNALLYCPVDRAILHLFVNLLQHLYIYTCKIIQVLSEDDILKNRSGRSNIFIPHPRVLSGPHPG